MPTWDKRWVLIQNEAISWRHSKKSEVAGSIELSNIESIHKVKSLKCQENKGPTKQGNEKADVRVFVLKSKKRTLCLMTGKGENCDKWVRAIQLQLDLRNGGTFSGPKNEKNQRKKTGSGNKYDVSF